MTTRSPINEPEVTTKKFSWRRLATAAAVMAMLAAPALAGPASAAIATIKIT